MDSFGDVEEEEDDKPDFGDYAGRGVGTLVILAFMAVATVGYYMANRHFTARGELYREVLGGLTRLPGQDVPLAQWEGRLVHDQGEVRVLEGARDPLLGVRADAVCIERDVFYYQWREEEVSRPGDSTGSVTRYEYVRRWVPRPVDSSKFRLPGRGDARRNFVLADIQWAKSPAARAVLGSHELADAVKKNFPDQKPLPLENAGIDEAALRRAVISEADFPGERLVHVRGNEVYFGRDPDAPAVGDVRVVVTAAWPGTVTVVARVTNGRLDEFVAENGERMALVWTGAASAGRRLGGMTLVNLLAGWGIRIALVLVYWLLFRFLALVHERKGGGAFFAALALACVVMAAVWFMNTLPTRIGS